jgi:hypothetical protein
VNSAGGEVVALDAAQYAPFTISESISIIAPVGAGISVPPAGTGVTVNSVPGNVIIRGLTINSAGGSNGILANSAGVLHVENCVINGFNGSSSAAGIQFNGSGKLLIKDTAARGNYSGIKATPFPSSVKVLVSMDGVQLGGNVIGIYLNGDPGEVQGAIRNSTIAANGTGINVAALSGGFGALDVESCLITNNDTGLFAQSFGGTLAGISISNCTISHNDMHGFQVVGPPAVAFITSRINNTIIGNGSSTAGFPTSYPAQ